MKIKVMLVDDHTMVREALRTVLDREPDVEVVAATGDGTEALRQAQESKPDVIVMDICMPGIDGIDLTRQLIAQKTTTKVLGLSTHFDRHRVWQMLEAGAKGYLPKSAGSDELLHAIRTLSQNCCYLSPEIASVVVDTVRGEKSNDPNGDNPLGPREREVLALLAEGLSSPDIASRLNIVTSTVDAHRRNIMGKLDLHSVAELTKYAIRCGLTMV